MYVFMILLPKHVADRNIAKFIIHDIDIRGATVVDIFPFDPEEQAKVWRSFFDLAIGSQLKVWISIAAVCYHSLPVLSIQTLTDTRHHSHLSAPSSSSSPPTSPECTCPPSSSFPLSSSPCSAWAPPSAPPPVLP